MTRTFNLQGLRDIAASEEDAAAAHLGDLNRKLQLHEQKLSLLQQYRSDYQERLRRAIASGLSSAGLRNFNDFIARLEQAIRQQQAAVDEARGLADLGKNFWHDKRRKSQAYDTLSQRAAAAALRIDNSREQKAQDDFASRTTRRPSLLER